MPGGFLVVDKFNSELEKSLFRLEKIKTDNLVFRLHYKLSVFLVVLFSISYSFTVWNKPIRCIGSRGTNALMAIEAVSDKCYVSGTYAITNLEPRNQVFPGIGTVTGEKTSVRYQHSYKWMYYFIFSSVVLLLMPRTVWRHIEDGRMQRLCSSLNGLLWSGPDDEKFVVEKNKLVYYLTNHMGYNTYYAYGFVVAEFLNLVVVGFLLYLWDNTAGNVFSQHGAHLYAFYADPYQRTDHLALAFPLLSKCTFVEHGYGGNLQAHDYICVMPLNTVNERAAVFFWYYFIALGILGLGALLVRCCIICSRRVRLYLLCGITSFATLEDAGLLIRKCSYSDWFIIYQMGNALDPFVFSQVIEQFIGQLRTDIQV